MSEAIRLYAGCQGGVVVYRSQDGNWQQISHSVPEGILDSLSGCVSRPERVFAGIAYDGVYRTDDGGKNWLKVLRGDVRSVTVDPNSDEVVYARQEPPTTKPMTPQHRKNEQDYAQIKIRQRS